MRLEYRRKSFLEFIVLIEDGDAVRSDWTVDRSAMKEFCDCSQNAGDWENRGGDEHTKEEYGHLVAYRTGYTLTAVNEKEWVERVEYFCN